MDLEHDGHHLIGRLDGLDFEQQIGHRGPGWKVTRKHKARPSGGQGHGPARAALFAHFLRLKFERFTFSSQSVANLNFPLILLY